MPDFMTAVATQTILKNTGGCLVVYRGQEAWFHLENPSQDDPFTSKGTIQGVAKILVGDSSVFPNLEENTLIVVNGDDWLVGDWETPGDGGVIWIALKTTTRT